MSHSHVVEWIFGTRIQSHWPCSTLCPISMFSRIFATLRPAVPSTQAGGKIEASSTIRLPSSSERWVLISFLMYAASAAPRDAITSARIASSSLPSCSMSSGLRWAIGLSDFFWIVVIGFLPVAWVVGSVVGSVVERARPGGRVDAGLDEHAAAVGLAGDGRGQVAAAQVAHGALLEREHAAVADAHPAARGHQHAGVLACHQ